MRVRLDTTGEFVLGFAFPMVFACAYAALVVPPVKPRVAAVADGD